MKEIRLFAENAEEIAIEIEFIGFPMLYDIFPDCRLTYVFARKSLEDLIEDLMNEYGEAVRQSLWNQNLGQVDETIQIMVNKRIVERGSFGSHRIEQGDKITFLRLLAGG